MIAATPQYVVYAAADERRTPGGWRFTVRLPGGRSQTVRDAEPGVTGDRLELLAVVRALESLEGPSRVTLYSPSRYVREGIERGLRNWREDQWTWEHFGNRVEVRDADLWQRLDAALDFHHIACRYWRFDSAESHAPNLRIHSHDSPRRFRLQTPSLSQRLAAWCSRQLDHWSGHARASWAS